MKIMDAEMEAGRMKNPLLECLIEFGIMKIMHAEMEAGRMKNSLLK